MNLEKVREHCLKKKGVTESLPFNEDSPVYKVMGKIFLIANLVPPVSISLKCDPEKAVELRERYDFVRPGYHLNKKHWNTVELTNTATDRVILEWIDDSYLLVINSLKKTDKDKLLKDN